MELKDKFVEYLIIDCKYSDNTIKNYEIIMNKFLNNLKCNNVLKTTKEDILNFIDYDLSIGNSNKTISNNLEVLRTFFKFLEIEDLISDNPMNDIDNPKNAKKIPRVLSVEEVKQILDIDLINAYSYRNKAMIELMYSSGLRISELINVKTYDIDLDIGSIRVMGKGSKERLIPVDDYALYYLKIYIEEYRILLNKKKSDYLFLNNRYEKISRQAFFNIIKDIAIKKNIKSTFSPHTLRHSFASHMVENGADLRSVQELLGHSNISTTQIYTNISDKFVSQNYKHSHPHGN